MIYAIGDAVYQDGTSYIALTSNFNVNPAVDVNGSGTTWAVLAQKGATGSSPDSGIPFTTVARFISTNAYFNPVQAIVGTSSTDNLFTWVPSGCTISKLNVYSKYSQDLKVDLQSSTTSGSGASLTTTGLSCTALANGNGCTATGPVTVSGGSFLIFHITQSDGTSAPSGTGYLWTAFGCL